MRIRRPSFPRAAWILAIAAPALWGACTDAPSDPVAAPDVQNIAVPQQAAGYAAALAAKERHTAALMSRAGVLGTGVGIDGDGSHVVTVYTLRPGAANVPQRVDGVSVVAVATGLIVAGDLNDPTSKERPAPNGFSIGHPDITAGTLGAIVTDGSSLFILSNNHVLANSNDASIGDASLQPGPYDGGTSSDQIGTLADFEPIDFSGGNNTIDAAISAVTDAVTAATPDYAYGAPTSTPVAAFGGQNVQKFGRTTGHTTGSVAETNVTVDVCYETRGWFRCVKLARFVDQISISPGSFSGGGDSGSLIVDSNRNPVGLLFAGSSTRTIANPIDAVLSRFGVTVTDGGSDGGGGDPPPNNPPSASFTHTCTDLTCDFDGTGSSDSDGSIASYDWDFGDGNTDVGATASHTYAANGTYTVTLTVTDDDNASDSASQEVTVSADDPPAGGFTLSASGYKVKGRHWVDLTWSGAATANVDIYRDGQKIATTGNDGSYTDQTDNRGGGSYTYQVCEAGTSTCSNTATVSF